MSHVRVPIHDEGDYNPHFMGQEQARNDRSVIAKIQGCKPGDMFGRVVASSGVTLNGKPVQILVCSGLGQPRDLLDHHDVVKRVGGLRQLARVATI